MDQIGYRLGSQEQRREQKKRQLFAACDGVAKADVAVVRKNSHSQRNDSDDAGQ